jgi:hypothetical protein
MFRTRGECVYINNINITDDEFGYALFVEGAYKIFEWLKIQGRATVFLTPSYTSAIWQFEYFYPGYSLIPALYLDGFRSFVQLNFKISKVGNIYLR